MVIRAVLGVSETCLDAWMDCLLRYHPCGGFTLIHVLNVACLRWAEKRDVREREARQRFQTKTGNAMADSLRQPRGCPSLIAENWSCGASVASVKY